MDLPQRIEHALSLALAPAALGPPRLAAAMNHAVFPRGARIRPRLCLAVHAACGAAPDSAEGLAAAAGIELLHCASLVHDDLPCFDNAAERRGRASVHHAFGEPLAVLCGDALIVHAFRAALGAGTAVLAILAGAAGAPDGIAAGQAWECETAIDLSRYQRSKTGALFSAAAMAGAAAAGAAPLPWRALGEALGEAYQVADDIRDVTVPARELGKPAGQDAAHARPNAVARLGLDGALDWLRTLTSRATASIPDCAGAGELRALIRSETQRLVPAGLAASAA